MAARLEEKEAERNYGGISLGGFDGVLKEIDARGATLRAKLILSAGGVEIDCIMDKVQIPNARESFDTRVWVEGTCITIGTNSYQYALMSVWFVLQTAARTYFVGRELSATPRLQKRMIGEMAEIVSHLFWDSCVFTAFLRGERAIYDVGSIEQFLDEAQSGQHRIYSSTIVFAEVLPSQILKSEIGSFQDFVDDVRGSIILIEASPNVMSLAGRLRDLPYRKGSSDRRRLGTGDAIMLASCIYLADAFGIESIFHTFDKGNKRGLEGKSVPLLSYHEWCEDLILSKWNKRNV